MRKLLEIHKPEELKILCKRFNIHGRLTKNQKIQKIIENELQGGIMSYRNVLGFVWDGILVEYLRTIGRKVRNHKTDLRLIIIKYWLRGSDPKTEGWTRVYIPQTAGLKEIVILLYIFIFYIHIFYTNIYIYIYVLIVTIFMLIYSYYGFISHYITWIIRNVQMMLKS